MSVIVQPILTTSCMACTIPFNITDKELDLESESFNKEQKNYDSFINVKYIIDINHRIRLELSSDKNKYDKRSRGSKIVSKKYKFNKNKEYRKKHNIFQPGRTNCNQRWCLK